jgi:predicted kinase
MQSTSEPFLSKLKPNLIIIRGIPGSGKSTLAKKYLQLMPNSVHCEADSYFTDMQGNYKYNPEKIQQAHHWCQQTIRAALAKGNSVVVSNTTIRLWELETLLAIGNEFSANIEVIRCLGLYASVHGVPENVINNMALRYEEWHGEINNAPG